MPSPWVRGGGGSQCTTTGTASGLNACCEGSSTNASGDSSFAIGTSTNAVGISSFCSGEFNTASGDASVCLGGSGNIASDSRAVVMGIGNTGSREDTVVSGRYTYATRGTQRAQGCGDSINISQYGRIVYSAWQAPATATTPLGISSSPATTFTVEPDRVYGMTFDCLAVDAKNNPAFAVRQRIEAIVSTDHTSVPTILVQAITMTQDPGLIGITFVLSISAGNLRCSVIVPTIGIGVDGVNATTVATWTEGKGNN